MQTGKPRLQSLFLFSVFPPNIQVSFLILQNLQAFTDFKVQRTTSVLVLRKHYRRRLYFSSGHREAGTVYLKNAMSSRTPGADSVTGTLAAFRLPWESVSQAGSLIQSGVG